MEKVGDIIFGVTERRVGNSISHSVNGLFAKIIYMDVERFTLEFYKNINGHDGNFYGQGIDGRCWIVYDLSDFKKVKMNNRI